MCFIVGTIAPINPLYQLLDKLRIMPLELNPRFKEHAVLNQLEENLQKILNENLQKSSN